MELMLVIGAGILAIIYGIVQTMSLLKASAGNEKMQEIAKAIQEGANAYLKRQYLTIAAVGVVVFIGLIFTLGFLVAIGFVVGSVLSGLASLCAPMFAPQKLPASHLPAVCRLRFVPVP